MNDVDITVVMAIYKPRLDWLAEELISISNQTYRGFQVLVWNDCPEDNTDYNTFFRQYLGDISFIIYRGSDNLGSNVAFENLTRKVTTPFIAYSDQDDIWMLNKLEQLHMLFDRPQITLAFSDMEVINEKSEVVARNIQGVRPRQKFYTGKDALSHLLAKNFVTGCTMMMRTDIAQAAIPFSSSVFHDWWLAVCAAMKGEIVKSHIPLMKYRIYTGNQSGVLKGVVDKKSYFEIRIEPQYRFIQDVIRRFGETKETKIMEQWMITRLRYFLNPSLKYFKEMLYSRKVNLSTTYFELALPFFPNSLFKHIISMIKKGVF